MGYARFAVALVLPTLLVPSLATADEIDRFTNWPTVNNDRSGTRFSPLTQINRDNVKTLSVAWTYNTGDAGDKTTIECTPIVIDGVMYLTTVKTRIVAIRYLLGPAIAREPRANAGERCACRHLGDQSPLRRSHGARLD